MSDRKRTVDYHRILIQASDNRALCTTTLETPLGILALCLVLKATGLL